MKIYHSGTRYLVDILKNNEYSFLMKYPVVIDIGANVGAFSIWIYDFAEKIYAIEPVKEVFDLMRKTIVENHLTKIKTYEEAIACNTGIRKMRMVGSPYGGAWTIVDESGKPDEYREVRAIRMADFMKREGIIYADLVKIDVESAEGEIFKDETFPFDRIGTIIGELHNNWSKGKNNEELKAILRNNGYGCESFKGGHFIARKV